MLVLVEDSVHIGPFWAEELVAGSKKEVHGRTLCKQHLSFKDVVLVISGTGTGTPLAQSM